MRMRLTVRFIEFIYLLLLINCFFVHMPLGLYIAIWYLLITHGGICTYLGVILILYARYILAFRLPYVRYTLACSARSLYIVVLNLPAILNLIWPSHPFYMRMRTTISDEHSIVTMLRSTRLYWRPKSLQRGCVTRSLSAAE